MSWEFWVILMIVYQYGFLQAAIKGLGSVKGSRARKLVCMYFFAATLALVALFMAPEIKFQWSRLVMMVFVLGVVNAFGAYCQWRAYDASMARTAMLSKLDDLFAIGLGYLLLGELGVLTPTLTLGVIVAVASGLAYAMMKTGGQDEGSRYPIRWVLGYSGIRGVALFSMRYFSLQGVSVLVFAAAWYVGSLVGALLTRFFILGEDEIGESLTSDQHGKMFILAVTIWTALMFAYWLRNFIPITVIQPIQLVAEMTVPAAVAFLFFGEAQNISRKEMLAIAGCLVGVVLIMLSF